QPTKQAFLYVFNRETGQPIWPIEERPVAKGDVPGEWYAPTQPFVTRPPAYDRQGVQADDLIDFTPELRSEAVKLVSKYKTGPIFTPPVVSQIDGPLATLMGAFASNWPGGSYDPDTHIAYVHSQSGVTPHAVKKHPALKGVKIVRRSGQPGNVGTLVTKALLIAGEPRVTTTSTGQRGAMLRAYDKATGNDVGAVYMPAQQTGSPMTYLFNGRQYIVVAISGGNYSGELLAFRLPQS